MMWFIGIPKRFSQPTLQVSKSLLSKCHQIASFQARPQINCRPSCSKVQTRRDSLAAPPGSSSLTGWQSWPMLALVVIGSPASCHHFWEGKICSLIPQNGEVSGPLWWYEYTRTTLNTPKSIGLWPNKNTTVPLFPHFVAVSCCPPSFMGSTQPKTRPLSQPQQSFTTLRAHLKRDEAAIRPSRGRINFVGWLGQIKNIYMYIISTSLYRYNPPHG